MPSLEELQIALNESRERAEILQNILDNVPSMIGYWDENLINRYSNKAYVSYFNKGKSEIEGRHILELLGDELYQKNLPFLKAALAGKPQIFERAIPILDGTIRHTQAHYIPDNRTGQIHGVFVLVFDVTPTVRAAEEKANLYQKISESYKMIALGEMAGGVAHEINTPLSIIAVNVTLAERLLSAPEFNSEEFKKILTSIQRTTERIGKIVKGLLTFSRDRSSEPSQQVSLLTILEDTLSFCREKFKASGIELIYQEPDPEFRLRCRPVEISQILVNLLNNSFDAIQKAEKKWIAVEYKVLDKEVEISVSDSGPEIPKSTQAKMMQPFFTTKELGKGTGMGLSLSKGLAENHGGRLVFDKAAPHTRFVLYLPNDRVS